MGDLVPSVAESAFVDPSARLMGEVTLADGVNVWAGAVIRGDDAPVSIGEGSAVLENCIVEAPVGKPVTVAPNALISHGAILHGCTVETGALVGIGAIVLDGAVVGRGTVVGAGAVVPPGTRLPAGKLVLGTPARPVRDLTAEERAEVGAELARLANKAKRYKQLFATTEST